MIDTLKTRLLAVNHPGVNAAIEAGRVKVIRHTPVFDQTHSGLLFDREAILAFTARQGKDVLKGMQFVICLVKEKGTDCIFITAYEIIGHLSRRAYEKRFGLRSPESARVFYDLQTVPEFDVYANRLVVDWGVGTLAWHQTKLDKKVLALKREGFVVSMPIWNRVIIPFQTLQAIMNEPAANADWENFLTTHDGVYLIRHVSTGKLYVGSAYGKDKGLWGRWEAYVQTRHNSNKGLVALLNNGHSANDFEFSLLEVFTKGTTAQVVIDAEKFHKERLGTRAPFGLNEN